jgi:hypothetical protein
MKSMSVISKILAVLFVLCFIIKTVHFNQSVHRRKTKYWFYFPKASIINSHSLKSKAAKQVQNFLSFLLLIIFILIIISLLVYQSSAE